MRNGAVKDGAAKDGAAKDGAVKGGIFRLGALAPQQLLGSGTGPLRVARPALRLGCGALLVSAIVLSPRTLATGGGFALLLAGIMVLATGAPSQVVRGALKFGALLYLPLALVLIVPLAWSVGKGWSGSGGLGTSDMAGAGDVVHALAIAATIALKGGAALLVAISALATIRQSELHAALAGLPLPRLVRLLLLQIVQQAGTLLEETVQIRRAVALRTPSRRGWGEGWRLLRALPHTWLERVAGRADRVAMALELRNYQYHGWVPLPAPTTWRLADSVVLAGALLALVAGLTLHLVG